MRHLIIVSLFVLYLGCQNAETQTVKFEPSSGSVFSDYWHQGLAELTRYDLTHARYGELRKGEAVIIFVTEDFRTDKWVKLDDYAGDGKAKSVPILKANMAYHFNTGIYPYSILTSVFSPLDLNAYPHALKTSTTVQEWCGHVYTQLLNKRQQFEGVSHSYFENEADEELAMNMAWLEDELWTRIRISPQSLPNGSISIIPALKYARLLHRKPAVEKADASVSESADGLVTFTLKYVGFERELKIKFEKAFPHEIVRFEETYIDGFGANGKRLTTVGQKTNSLRLDYWNKNRNADSTYRKELGLAD